MYAYRAFDFVMASISLVDPRGCTPMDVSKKLKDGCVEKLKNIIQKRMGPNIPRLFIPVGDKRTGNLVTSD